jgi:hypothetical protein
MYIIIIIFIMYLAIYTQQPAVQYLIVCFKPLRH